MATHKSALKRNRQNKKRRERNRTVMSRMKSFVRKAVTVIEEGTKGNDLDLTLRLAEKEIRKAATKGVIPKRTASRRVARLARARDRTLAAQPATP